MKPFRGCGGAGSGRGNRTQGPLPPERKSAKNHTDPQIRSHPAKDRRRASVLALTTAPEYHRQKDDEFAPGRIIQGEEARSERIVSKSSEAYANTSKRIIYASTNGGAPDLSASVTLAPFLLATPTVPHHSGQPAKTPHPKAFPKPVKPRTPQPLQIHHLTIADNFRLPCRIET